MHEAKVRNSLFGTRVVNFILGMTMFVYFLTFITANATSPTVILYIVISTFSGVLFHQFFLRIHYTIGWGLAASSFVSFPLLMTGFSIWPVMIVFVFSFWRVQKEFGYLSEVEPEFTTFFPTNNLLFVSFSILTLLFTSYLAAVEHIKVYLFCTFYFMLFRMFNLIFAGLHEQVIKRRTVLFLYSVLIGIGSIGFFVFYTFSATLRQLILGVFGALFSGALLLFGKSTQRLHDWITNRLRQLLDDVELPDPIDTMALFGEQLNRVGDESANWPLLSLILVFLVVSMLFLYKIRRNSYPSKEGPEFKTHIHRRGRKEKVVQQSNYSSAANMIRKEFKKLELEAVKFNMSRFQGETAFEWFERMDWLEDGAKLVLLYETARYGDGTISKRDETVFFTTLQKIKEKNFKKEV